MAENHPVSDNKHKSSLNSGASYSGNGRSSTAVAERGSSNAGAAAAGGGGGGLSGGLSQPAGWQSLLSFTILFLAWLAGFSSRLFAVIRFESIIHEFDPWHLAPSPGYIASNICPHVTSLPPPKLTSSLSAFTRAGRQEIQLHQFNLNVLSLGDRPITLKKVICRYISPFAIC